MRNTLVLGILSSSLLLHAQAVPKGSSAKLEAKNETASLLSGPGTTRPATDATTTPQPFKISTGVIGPKLISGQSLTVPAEEFPLRDAAKKHMIVNFTVDQNGVPQGVRLLKSVNQAVDNRILNAVRQYRFAPATLDDQTVPVEVNLQVFFAQK